MVENAKPPNPHPNRTTEGMGNVKKPAPNIPWNDRDITAYTSIGLEAPYRIGMYMRRFLNQVDVSKAPVERTVTAMVRLKAPDYLGVKEGDKQKKPERKEFLVYRERFEGVDWRGVPIMPVDDIMEGVYTKQYTRPHINNQSGEVDYMELDAVRAHLVHYIPFTKKKVDEVISNSAKSDKDTIIYTVKFATEDFTFSVMPPSRCQFTYDQFNWKWDDICKYHVRPIVQAAEEYRNENKSSYNMAFEPT